MDSRAADRYAGYDVVTAHSATSHLRAFVRGSGPMLALVPAIGRPPHDLLPLADHLLAAGYRVTLTEPRGIGESHGELRGITLHDLARDVAAIIDTVGQTPVVAIGHAFGNRVARTLAADRPDLVRAVVLISASGKVHMAAEIAEANRVALATDLPEDVRARAARQAWFAPDSDVSPWLRDWSMPVREACIAAAEATPAHEWSMAGRAPVLIVQGLHDASAPPENGRLLKEELGDRAVLVELPDVGHALPIEQPLAVAQVVIDYIRALAAPRAY